MSTYVLGAGAMGSLVAHELAVAARSVPTLLLKSKLTHNVYTANGGAVSVVRSSKQDTTQDPVKINAISGADELHLPQMQNLIVATKTHNTVDALKPYVPFITSATNIVLVQNGMGVVPHLRSAFWPSVDASPRLFQAISTHGAYKSSLNVVHHVGFGSLLLSEVPAHHDAKDPAESEAELPQIITNLLGCSQLNASYIPYSQFLPKQMEKLVVNACINPLTAVLDCLNGDLLYASNVVSIFRKVINEGVSCFEKEFDLNTISPDAGTILSRDRLLTTVLSICQSTAQNSSSMREDVRRLNVTEIDAINGYIVQLGRKNEIPTPSNRMLCDLINCKFAIERSKENAVFNFT